MQVRGPWAEPPQEALLSPGGWGRGRETALKCTQLGNALALIRRKVVKWLV